MCFPLHIFTEPPHGKKQAIMIYENEIDQLHTQVRNLKATSAAEKDALIAKYEAMVKESKGQIIYKYKQASSFQNSSRIL